jgi:hypothetical protein
MEKNITTVRPAESIYNIEKVVLPQPERPVIEIISPLCAEKLR